MGHRSDLDRMKQGPAYLTPEQAAAKRRAAEAKREQEQEISAQRKQKMLQVKASCNFHGLIGPSTQRNDLLEGHLM